MKMVDYVKLSLKKEFMEKIQKFIEDYPEEGYRSLAQFAEDAVRRRADELHVSDRTPRFEHFNTYEEHATIKDKKFPNRFFDIYLKSNGKLWCEICDSMECEHVNFAFTVPGIMRALEKRTKL